ncbi:hypothetical protein [Chitinophaga sp.]|uniref:hypothetical protein n=1 Tax=Chitinophaga sp. TaxID=1869181 RepID=UPI0031E3A733
MYWYYELRADNTYSQKMLTSDVLSVLGAMGELRRIGNQQFTNMEGFPWMTVAAVNSSNGNYGREEDFNSEWVTLIAVVGSQADPENEAFYVDLLTRIAEKLNWELILEVGSDGNTDVVLREKVS